ncbi:MAG TPA: condensation domain-containing protein, partial [Thermoanaerobaculia bacterium]|nr:condensation domain-containing protein [Thermoanaerobaculia bacterium]
AWWRRELEGAPAVLALPLDRPRPEVQRFRGSLVRSPLPAGLAGAVSDLARREGATPFMVLLAAFQAVLGRVNGEKDFLLGAPFANRPRPELEGLIGLFIETLPLRARLEGDPPFRDLIGRVRESTLRAFAHQDLPLDRLITGLGLERVTSHNLLVQVLFSLQDGLEEGFALPGLQARPIDTGLTTPRLDLALFVETVGGNLRASLEFDASLFEEETARRLLAGYLTLLTAAAGDPVVPLSELPFLSPAEETQLRARSRPAWHAPAAKRIPATGDRFTPAAELVARIWCDLLGLKSVEHGDNFFHLGGHSLLAARVRARVREMFGLDLPVQTLFRAPTVAGLAGIIAGALRGSDRPVLPPLRCAPRKGRLPLSFGQERFRFLGGLDAAGAVYNVPLGLLLDGALDTAGLEAALRGIVGRHEALRTRFIEVDGISIQEIAPAGGPELPRIDLAALPEEARTAELARLAHREAMAPFDLARTPLRARLIRLEAKAHALLLTFHHAVFDGWSQGVFGRELAALYAAAVEGRPADLPKLPVQYADYAVWQRGWLTGEVQDGLLSWWRGELEGAPRVLELPTDRLRPEVQDFRGGVVQVELSTELAAGVADLARRAGATRYMVLLAAFQALLGRLTGQQDLLVGSPFANRPLPELEGLIGLFVETLTLRGRLGGDPSFRELLARVRETAFGAFAHQDLPFERLVAGLRVERSAARSPLIQAMFSLQDGGTEGITLPGLAVRPLEIASATAKLDLLLVVEETAGGGLRAILEYDADLFEAVTARRHVERFVTLVRGALAHPEARLSDLPVLSEAERHQVRAEWNDTAAPVEATPSVRRLVEDQARRTPGALAVAREEKRMTFSELDLWAGRLAHRLRRLGVGPEVRVAVGLERSLAGVASLLAVWKAGGAYVPLDPAHPLDRLAAVLEDCAAPVLIAQGPLAAALSREGLQLVDPGGVKDEWEAPLESAGPEDLPDGLAYVIYTSGSTGRPKGVEVSHRSLLNLVAWHRSVYGLTAADRTSLLARVGFDASVWELWPTLAAGASLWLPEAEIIASPDSLRDWLVDSEIAVSFVPTPLAELLLGVEWPETTTLRFLLTGGDALRRRPPAGLPFALINHYGPTEATVVSTAGGAVRTEGSALALLPSIGHPIANVRVRVMDPVGRPVPAGVPGELWIGGGGLARGYLGSPALTA